MPICMRPIWPIFPQQLAWGAAKRVFALARSRAPIVHKSAIPVIMSPMRTVPNQQTFCCVVCGHTTHADVNAAENLASRLGFQELAACADR